MLDFGFNFKSGDILIANSGGNMTVLLFLWSGKICC